MKDVDIARVTEVIGKINADLFERSNLNEDECPRVCVSTDGVEMVAITFTGTILDISLTPVSLDDTHDLEAMLRGQLEEFFRSIIDLAEVWFDAEVTPEPEDPAN